MQEVLQVKYRKKPVEVEAVRWTGRNDKEMKEFLGLTSSWWLNVADSITIDTPGEKDIVKIGDWIIKDGGGFYPCGAETFDATYEEA